MARINNVMFPGAVMLTAGLLGSISCSRDVSLAGRAIPSVTVRTVSHYGVTLDEQASPEQVAYVLLRAIRDDFEASDGAGRKAALAIQFDICAANALQARNNTSSSRDEFVYKVVYRWTPTVSHYARGFETALQKAQARFVRRESPSAANSKNGAEECEILMEVDDPNGDPNAQAVLVVWLIQDSGYWRVTHLGFAPAKRSIERN